MSDIVRRQLTRLAAKVGYAVMPTWRLESYAIVKYLSRLFEFLDVDLVIDVGANAGQYYRFLRNHVGFRGHVASFEPIPRHANTLREARSRDPKLTVTECGLGAIDGHMEFNVMENTEFSSFLTPEHTETQVFRGLNEVNESIRVEIKTLDGILPDLIDRLGSRSVYLKMDTQGYDMEVLKGAAKVLSGISALQTEASVVRIYDGMPMYHEVISYLEQRDFVMSKILPNNEGSFPILVDFDCYMINRAFISGR